MKLVVTGSKTSKIHLSDREDLRSLCGLKMSHEMTEDSREELFDRWGACSKCLAKEQA